jgi:hypothetical protein
LERVHKSPAVANLAKLPFFNEQHIRKMAVGNEDSFQPLLNDAKSIVHNKFSPSFTEEYITDVLKLMKVF